MGTSYEDTIKQQATPYLEDGEQVCAAFIARPRGCTGGDVQELARVRAGSVGI